MGGKQTIRALIPLFPARAPVVVRQYNKRNVNKDLVDDAPPPALTYLYTPASKAVHGAKALEMMGTTGTSVPECWGVHVARGKLAAAEGTVGPDVDEWLAVSRDGPIVAVSKFTSCAAADRAFKCKTLGLGCGDSTCPCIPNNLGGAANHASGSERANCRLWPDVFLERGPDGKVLYFRFGLVLNKFGRFPAHTPLLLDYGPLYGPMTPVDSEML